jgi:prolyl-tRNA synthetase
MELIGIPHRVVIGDKHLDDGKVEYRGRRDTENSMVDRGEVVALLRARIDAELAGD